MIIPQPITKISQAQYKQHIDQVNEHTDQTWPHPVYALDFKGDVLTTPDTKLADSELKRIQSALVEASNSSRSSPVLKGTVHIMMSYPLVAKFEKSIMWTDGLRTFFNPHCTAVLSDPEIVAIMIHEAGHQFLDDCATHMEYGEKFDTMSFSDATDAKIPGWFDNLANLIIDPVVDRVVLDAACVNVDSVFIQCHIERCQYAIDQFIKLCSSTGARCDGHHRRMSDDNFDIGVWYDSMHKTNQSGILNKWDFLFSVSQLAARAIDIPPPKGGSGGKPGIGNVKPNKGSKSGTVRSKQQAATDNACKQAGIDPGSMGLKLPEEVQSNKLDDYLPQLISARMDGEYDYISFDPVAAQFGASLPVKIPPPAIIGVALDVSGSVVYCPQEFAVLLAELSTSLQHPNVDSVKLVLFDHGDIRDENVIDLDPFDDISKALEHVSGGGGTEFDAPVEYLETCKNKDELAAIIVLTDGYARFNADKHVNDIPRIWVSTGCCTKHLDPEAEHILLVGRQGASQ